MRRRAGYRCGGVTGAADNLASRCHAIISIEAAVVTTCFALLLLTPVTSIHSPIAHDHTEAEEHGRLTDQGEAFRKLRLLSLEHSLARGSPRVSKGHQMQSLSNAQERPFAKAVVNGVNRDSVAVPRPSLAEGALIPDTAESSLTPDARLGFHEGHAVEEQSLMQVNNITQILIVMNPLTETAAPPAVVADAAVLRSSATSPLHALPSAPPAVLADAAVLRSNATSPLQALPSASSVLEKEATPLTHELRHSQILFGKEPPAVISDAMKRAGIPQSMWDKYLGMNGSMDEISTHKAALLAMLVMYNTTECVVDGFGHAVGCHADCACGWFTSCFPFVLRVGGDGLAFDVDVGACELAGLVLLIVSVFVISCWLMSFMVLYQKLRNDMMRGDMK